MLHHYINGDLYKVRGIDGDLDWFVMNYLCEAIDNDKD